MEYGLPLTQSSVPSKVKVWRNIAAVLLSLPIIWYAIGGFVYFGILSPVLIVSLLSIVAFAMLAYAASNRPTRNMMYVLIGKAFVWILLLVVSNFVDSFRLPAFMGFCWNMMNPLLDTYVLSVILRNSRMEEQERSWVGLMVIYNGWYFVNNMFFYIPSLASIGTLDFPEIFSYELYSNFSMVWDAIWKLLLAAAWFKIARSNAFSGNIQSSRFVSGTYTPLNKYVIAVVLISGLIVGLLWIYYEYAAPALRQL